jgi:hypothetical protein
MLRTEEALSPDFLSGLLHQGVLSGLTHQPEWSITEGLGRFQLEPDALTESLTIDADVDVTLTNECKTALAPLLIRTESVDEFKSWIGTNDIEFASNPALAGYWQLPEKPWNGRPVTDPQQLTSNERQEIEKAGWAYIFGDARTVASYRQVIELLSAPFEAAIYAARKVTIRPGGRLIVSGIPAILLFEEVELHARGKIVTYTPCAATFGKLEKIEQPTLCSPELL